MQTGKMTILPALAAAVAGLVDPPMFGGRRSRPHVPMTYYPEDFVANVPPVEAGQGSFRPVRAGFSGQHNGRKERRNGLTGKQVRKERKADSHVSKDPKIAYDPFGHRPQNRDMGRRAKAAATKRVTAEAGRIYRSRLRNLAGIEGNKAGVNS